MSPGAPGNANSDDPINWALDRVIDASRVIELRKGVKPTEDKRITEAAALLANKPDLDDSQASKRRNLYYEFLLRVHEIDFSFVILCAVGLGPSAVVNLKDRCRVELPSKICEIRSQLESHTLGVLRARYYRPGLDILYCMS